MHEFAQMSIPSSTPIQHLDPRRSHGPHTMGGMPGQGPPQTGPNMTPSPGQAYARMAPIQIQDSEIGVDRKISDVPWLFFFILTVLGGIYIAIHAFIYGDIAYLYKGVNYNGKICGIDTGVRNLPYLYWPVDPSDLRASSTLLLKDARCVHTCPTQEDVEEKKTVPVIRQDIQISERKTSTVTMQFKLQTPVYKTRLVANAYCIPVDPNLQRQLLPVLSTTSRQLAFAIGSFASTWGAIVGYACMGVCICTFLIWMLRFSPNVVIFLASLLVLSSTFATGIHLIASNANVDDKIIGEIFSLNYSWSLAFGILLVVIGVLLVGILLSARGRLRTTSKVLDAANEPISDIGTIFVLPLCVCSASILFFVFWMFVLLKIAGMGEVTSEVTKIALESNGHTDLIPLQREIFYPASSILAMIFWIFLFFWVYEFLLSYSQFVVMYTGTVWYFASPEGAEERDIGWCPAFIAMSIGLSHHIGSLALGGLIMGLTRPIRILFSWTSFKYMNSPNNCVQLLYRTFGSFSPSTRAIVDRFVPTGYVEMSMSSTGFFSSMRTASQRLTAPTPTARMTGYAHTLSWMLNWSISTLMGYFTYLTVSSDGPYSSNTSIYFISSPILVALTSTLLTGMLISHVTAICDCMADVLLYCFIVESIQPNGHFDEDIMTKYHAPPQLRDMVVDALEEREYFF